MRDWIELGPTPAGESCAQVGQNSYAEQARKEGRAYINQLERMFPNPPGSARFALKSFPHDFGTYFEVCVVYNDDSEAEWDFAFEVERNLPEFWDDEAKVELGLL